ncbi:MAG: IS110 family transposase [Saprospiraceae bacterium]|uniref:IS110 family transposase n=1 Tax=Candidatus Opimibacter skivensis TaxID=2982028 RepID=A0A9D7SQ18_9BACT|nr:IS110 family transposase [Candidatus Opimibacter skivensis]
MKTKNTACPKLFIGIDIHKTSWSIRMATDLFQGKRMTMPSDPENLKRYIEKYYPDHEIQCAYEAGCCGYSAHRAFESFGWQSIVFNPSDIARTGKSQFQKTDGIDADLICRELRDNRLVSITVPDVEREHLRCLFRRRNDLVKDIRQIKSQIKGQLLFMGIRIPQEHDNSYWSHSFRKWIESLSMENETAKSAIRSRLLQFEFLDKSVREVSNELRKYCRTHYKKDYTLLRSIPGIGGIVACGILSELGDLRRFGNFKQLAAYVGLMPALHQSGDNTRSSGINPRGNSIMRSYFVEAAWQALRFDPVMQKYYRTHAGRDSKSILIKVARKLLSRVHSVIKTETPYQIGVIA